ncbi:hypothetical protein EJ110_NYTH57430 [Nymphaea thermarum]|nr:hypothetical protein EJ110_NYTH57430 [Nymphaea thermarum]
MVFLLSRLGLRSLVLELADSLRASGFALTQWSNAWKAMDALGVGDLLRQHHTQLRSVVRLLRRSYATLLLQK